VELNNSDLRVLAVDDDESGRVLIGAALEQLAIADIHLAKDGVDALRQFDRLERKPDVVVCDLYMPNMDGIEVISALEARNYAGGIVVVSGADPRVVDVARLMVGAGRMQFLGALVKPVTSEALGPLLGREVLF
jgi:CheY-like chemotaxis protein